MVSMIDDGGRRDSHDNRVLHNYAHPIFWALVGDGGQLGIDSGSGGRAARQRTLTVDRPRPVHPAPVSAALGLAPRAERAAMERQQPETPDRSSTSIRIAARM